MPKKSLWQQTRAKALKYSAIPPEHLEPALDELEALVPLNLDAFEHEWTESEFVALEGEELAQAKDAQKSVATGWYRPALGRAGDPLPNTNNTKIQVTVADGTLDLLTNWAAAEDRGISEVTNVAIQAGLRALRADGAIPEAALNAYEKQCQQRIAEAQARRVISSFIGSCSEALF